jgi:hypothetical protein
LLCLSFRYFPLCYPHQASCLHLYCDAVSLKAISYCH